MEIFPETILAKYGLKTKQIWNTIITDMSSGKEQRAKKWAFPKCRLELPYGLIAEDKIKDLWQFYQACSGAYKAFWFYVLEFRHWYGVFVGQGDGEVLIFDLPSKSTDDDRLTVYVDGEETAVTFSEGGGEAESDRITFSSAPDEGAVITADLYGKLRSKARFEIDELEDELFHYMLYNFGIPIIEVK